MNSQERVMATIQGKPKDRVAIAPTLPLYGARLTECPLQQYYTDVDSYVRGQVAVRQLLKPDVLYGPFSFPLEGTAFGSQVRWFETQPPNLTRPAIESIAELDKLSMPDIKAHPVFRFIHESIHRLADTYAGEVPIAAVAINPVDLPVMIMGIDNWLQTMLFDPEGTQAMLALTIPHFVGWANMLLEAGAAFVVSTSAFVSGTIVTHSMAETIGIPALQTAFAQLNGPVVLHNTGAPIVPHMDLLASIPNVAGFALNHKESYAEARDIIGPEPVLVGGTDGTALQLQSRSEVWDTCWTALEDRREDAHFILGTDGADISYNTPMENIYVFHESVLAFAER